MYIGVSELSMWLTWKMFTTYGYMRKVDNKILCMVWSYESILLYTHTYIEKLSASNGDLTFPCTCYGDY